MTDEPRHHPSDASLACYAAGAMPSPAALCMKLHIRACSECRRQHDEITEIAAAAIGHVQPVPMSAASVEAALMRLDVMPGRCPKPAAPKIDMEPHDLSWAAPGIRRRLVLQEGRDRVWLLRMEPGAVVSRHRHTGSEYTFFAEGKFRDEHGEYHACDLREYNNEDQDRLVCVGDGPGLGLLAVEGPLRYRNPLWRMVLPAY